MLKGSKVDYGRAQRKLAAVLVADVVGYSAHMGRDENATRARFNHLLQAVVTPSVSSHAGRVVKISGDGVLVEFASVVEAVNCAVQWQREIELSNAALGTEPQLLFRIGINLGDIIVEGDDIHGDGVNVAARLEAMADPGGIILSRSARDQVIDKIALDLTDMGQVEAKNIARPVHVYKIALNSDLNGLTPTSGPSTSRRLLAVGAAATVAIAGLLLWWQPWSDTVAETEIQVTALPLPDKPSVAVMPFTNLSDEAGVWITDALSQEVANSLSQVSALFVISSSSTFRFKDKAVPPQQVAQELGVHSVVLGSVRGANDDLKVSVQIVDGSTGITIWSDEFDKTSGDTFALKEDISHSIARELANSISRSSAPQRTTHNDEAYLLWYRASREVNKAPSVQGYDFARTLALSALTLDPDFGRAKAVLAYIATQNGYFGFVEDRVGAMKAGLSLAKEAVSLAPEDWYTHEMLGFSLMNVRDYEASLEAFDKAISLAPSSDSTLVRSALPLLFLGRADEAERRLLTAMRINPLYNWAPANFLAMAYYEQERYEEAVSWFDKAATLNPGFIGNMVWRSAAHAQTGNDETARKIAAEVIKAAPKWSISNNFVQIKDKATMERLNEGLRKAGLPE